MHDQSDVAIVCFRSQNAGCFYFLAGKFEAWAVLAVLTMDARTNRPLTHEAIAGVIETLGGRLCNVKINRFAHQAYHAELTIDWHGSIVLMDVRPSDAIATALVASVPIYISPVVLRAASARAGDHIGPE